MTDPSQPADPGADPGRQVPPAEAPPQPGTGYAPPSYGQYAQPGYGQPGYQGYQPSGYPPPGYYPPAARMNVLAIISLVAGIVGLIWIPLLGSLAAVIMGHLGLRQIRVTGERGHGLAKAGTILGYIGLALAVIGIIGIIVFIAVIASHPDAWQNGTTLPTS